MRTGTLALFLSAVLASSAAGGKPNILLVITDDQGFGDLGLHQNPVVRTPHLDRFAKEGVQFRNFYVSPVCSPTRSSLMTGRYNYRTGVVDTYIGRSMMHADEQTMAELLGGAGYRTGIFGKWHLGDHFPMRPQDQGFQESVIHLGGGIGQPADPPGNHYSDPVLQLNGKAKPFAGYCTDIFTDQAIRFIGNGGEKPFFAYVAFNCPHGPFEVPEPLVKPYRSADLTPDAFPKIGNRLPKWNVNEVAKVYAMVENIDTNFGRLLRHLREQKLAENTLVIFLTDNGPGGMRFNGGLRAAKGTVYEGGIRVPCFMQYPSRFREAKTIDTIAAHIDLLPTITELCELQRPQDIRWDGVSLLPLLDGRKQDLPERTLFFQWHRGDVPEMGRAFAARTPTYKLVQSRGVQEGSPFKSNLELFDISKDPFEQSDLAATHPEIVKRLQSQYEDWFRDVSKTRGFAPPRIRLGNDAENPSTLTRQDWRGPKAGWTPQSIGHWEVSLDRPGNYVVTLQFAPAKKAEKAIVQFGGQRFEKSVAVGDREIRLECPKMGKGDTRIAPRIESIDGDRGCDYVVVERISD